MKNNVLLPMTGLTLLAFLALVCMAAMRSSVIRADGSRTALSPGMTFLPASIADTLTARVCRWNSLETKRDSSRDRKEILEGGTPDLSMLEIHASTLEPGMAPHPPHSHADMEELLIVRRGLRATINGNTSLLGPGSIAVALPGDQHGFVNAGSTKATYYVLKFQSRSPLNGQEAGPPAAPLW